MKQITLFYLQNCPHCQQAFAHLAELKQQPEYRDIEITQIEESEEAELAEQYDYFYVPTFYIGAEKVHEGHVEKEDVERVLRLALQN